MQAPRPHPLLGKRAAFYTLGCRLNYAETSTIARQLAAVGIKRIPDEHHHTHDIVPDICIVNSCSVTDTADKKCRNLINRLHREYPEALIVVTGCYAQLQGDKIAAMPGVDLVVGSGRKSEITSLLTEQYSKRTAQRHKDSEQPAEAPQITSRKELRHFEHSVSSDDRTRHFLKVQDGCNYYCTYCTIPLARGISRNGSIASLVEQAEHVAQIGGKEIILTGVNIGDFGRSTGETLIELLQALTKVEGIARYRIGSIEPELLTPEIIRYVAETPQLMPHFHIPLQSGSDHVLRLMRRHYDTSLFAERLELIYRLIPDAFVGIDVIAGMRGELSEHHTETLAFLSEQPWSQLHVFPYSERKGTKALEIKPIVSSAEKKRRTQVLLALSSERHEAFCAPFAGSTRPVLWEETAHGEMMEGFTDNYIRVSRPYDETLAGEISPARLERWERGRQTFITTEP